MPERDADLIARLRRGTETITPTADPSARIADRVQARRRRRRLGAVGAGVGAVALVGVAIGVAVPSSGGHRTTVDVSAPPPAPPAVTQTAVLAAPEGLAVSPDGDLLIDNQGTNQILERDASGELTVLAGDGKAGFAGDGGPASRAELNRPDAVAVATNGTIYVTDSGNNRIRAISPAGIITTVAGDGSIRGRTTGPARRAAIGDPTSVAVGSEGRLYLTDAAGLQVLQGGLLRTDFPTGHLNIRGTRTAWFPTSVAVDRSGDVYVADESPKLLVALEVPGEIPLLLPEYDLPLYASGIAVGPEDELVVADYGDFALDRIEGWRIQRVATFRRNQWPGLAGTFRPSAVAVAPDGTVYLATDGRNAGTNRPALVEIRPGGKPVLLGGSLDSSPAPVGPALRPTGIGVARFGQPEVEVVAKIQAELGSLTGPVVPSSRIICGSALCRTRTSSCSSTSNAASSATPARGNSCPWANCASGSPWPPPSTSSAALSPSFVCREACTNSQYREAP